MTITTKIKYNKDYEEYGGNDMTNQEAVREALKSIAAALVSKKEATHYKRVMEENEIGRSMFSGREGGLQIAINEIEDTLACDDDEIKEYYN